MSVQKTISPGENIIFYDGVCGLCNKFVQFVIAQGGGLKFLFCSLQSELAAELLKKFGVSNNDLNSILVITDYHLPSSRLLQKSEAVFFILDHCEKPWNSVYKYFSIFKGWPRFLLDFGYDYVASIRYQVFGHYDSCLIPAQEVRARFIDQ